MIGPSECWSFEIKVSVQATHQERWPKRALLYQKVRVPRPNFAGKKPYNASVEKTRFGFGIKHIAASLSRSSVLLLKGIIAIQMKLFILKFVDFLPVFSAFYMLFVVSDACAPTMVTRESCSPLHKCGRNEANASAHSPPFQLRRCVRAHSFCSRDSFIVCTSQTVTMRGSQVYGEAGQYSPVCGLMFARKESRRTASALRLKYAPCFRTPLIA